MHPDDYPRFEELHATYDTTRQWMALDQNLFEIDPHDIYKAKVLFTMMNGVVRHREGL